MIIDGLENDYELQKPAIKIFGATFVMALLCAASVLAETLEPLSEQSAVVNVVTDETDNTDETVTGSEATILGTCGIDIEWTLTSDETLAISGIGNMDDFTPEPIPWSKGFETVHILNGG